MNGYKIEVHAIWYIEDGRVEESEDGNTISLYDKGELVGVISKKDILSMHSCRNNEAAKSED